MTDANPYAAPKAEIRDLGPARERPAWVWVILVYYVLATILTALSYAVINSGLVPMPAAQQKYLASLSWFDHVASISLLTLRLAAAVQLFRLRKISALLFPSAFLLGLLYFGVRLAVNGPDVALGQARWASMAFGWAVAIAICVYAWRLHRRGVLS